MGTCGDRCYKERVAEGRCSIWQWGHLRLVNWVTCDSGSRATSRGHLRLGFWVTCTSNHPLIITMLWGGMGGVGWGNNVHVTSRSSQVEDFWTLCSQGFASLQLDRDHQPRQSTHLRTPHFTHLRTLTHLRTHAPNLTHLRIPSSYRTTFQPS